MASIRIPKKIILINSPAKIVEGLNKLKNYLDEFVFLDSIKNIDFKNLSTVHKIIYFNTETGETEKSVIEDLSILDSINLTHSFDRKIIIPFDKRETIEISDILYDLY